MSIQTNSTLNPILTKIANQFMRDPKGFVGLRLAPAFSTALQAANYYMFGADELANVPVLKARAPGSGYPRVTSILSNDTYFCQNYGLEAPVPDEERVKYASFFDVDIAKVRKITDTVKVNHEMRVHALATNTANVPNAGVAVKWDDPASNPKDDVDAAKEYIRLQCGMEVNLMVISNPVFLKLQQHPRLLDLFKFTTPGLLNEDKLANYFGLPQGGVAVAKTVQATNIEGQIFTPADIWGHDCILAHVEQGDSLEIPNFARTFYWDAFTSVVNEKTGGTGPAMTAGGGGPDLIQIMDYRDETKKSDIHRGEHFVGEKIVGQKAGFLLQSVLSFCLAFLLLLAVMVTSATAQPVSTGYPTAYPNFSTPDTNAAPITLTNGGAATFAAGGTNSLAKTIRQDHGLSVFVTVISTNGTATGEVLGWDTTPDGLLFTSTQPLKMSLPGGLTGTNTFWTNWPAATLNNVRKIQLTTATNQILGTAGATGSNTNTIKIAAIVYSQSSAFP